MIKTNELRVGNLAYFFRDTPAKVLYIFDKYICLTYDNGNTYIQVKTEEIEPIPLTEEWVVKFGFSVINENSAGKRYGYVINGVFRSDLTFTFWKTTKQGGKFYRADLQIKYVHQLQNLYFALTGSELQYVA